MELRHLRTFVAVADQLSFSKAAVRLRITQPALSRQIRDLEDEFGCRLFERSPHGIALTAAAVPLLSGARALLASADDLLARARDTARARALRLRIAHYGTLMALHAAPFAARLEKAHPGLTVELIEEDQAPALEMLRAGRCDAAFSGLPVPRRLRGLEHRVVWRTQPVAVLPADHRLAKKRRLTLPDLRDETWALWDESRFPGFGRGLIEACERAGYTPRIGPTVDGLVPAFAAVSGQRCVSYVARLATRLPSAGVVLTPFVPGSIDMPAILAWPSGSPHTGALVALAAAMDAADQREHAEPR